MKICGLDGHKDNYSFAISLYKQYEAKTFFRVL
jgi:hypothetical protein